MEAEKKFPLVADVEFHRRPASVRKLENPPSRYVLEEIMSQGRSELLKRVELVERLHAVDIQTDAVDLACSIVLRYYGVFACRPEVRSDNEDCIRKELQIEVLFLLQKTIIRLQHDFKEDSELRRIDKVGYQLFRNFVELCELRKETSRSARNYLSRIEEEHKILMDSCGSCVESFGAVSAWRENSQRMVLLEKICEHLCEILKFRNRGDDILVNIEGIRTLAEEYKSNIPAILMQHVTVTPHMVAEVASIDTGAPASWLLNSFQLPLDRLRDRLARRVGGQDHVIEKIASVMSKCHGRGSSPLASFLFLNGPSSYLVDLFESLAEELYDRKDRLLEIRLHQYVEHSSVNDEEDRKKHNALCEYVLKFVKAKPFSVIMIHDVEEYKYAAEFLDDLLTKGKLADADGNPYELSNVLVTLTSRAKVNGLNTLSGKCLEMDCPKKEAAAVAASSEGHARVLEIVSQMVDAVLILEDASPVDQDLISRLWLREIINSSLEKHQLIVYPSEALMHVASTFSERAMRCWFNEIGIPKIRRQADGLLAESRTIYRLDAVPGTRSLSCRPAEVDSEVICAHHAFTEILNRWKTAYQLEKRAAREILMLRALHSTLLSLLDVTEHAPDPLVRTLENMKNRLSSIISDSVSAPDLGFEQFLTLDGISRLLTPKQKEALKEEPTENACNLLKPGASGSAHGTPSTSNSKKGESEEPDSAPLEKDVKTVKEEAATPPTMEHTVPSTVAPPQPSPKAGPMPSPSSVTEDEIRAVLLQSQRVRAEDLVAKFKSRLKSEEDKDGFASILRRISTIRKDKYEAKYVVLRAG